MKKGLSVLLAIIMIFTALSVLCSCDTQDDQAEPQESVQTTAGLQNDTPDSNDNSKPSLVPSYGLEYTLNDDGVSYSVSIGDCTDTDIVIPSTYDGLPVTSIGDRAFVVCSSLTSVEIPSSVTSIGDYAFYYCSSLTSIEIPDSVTSIGNYAFEDCSSLTSVTVESGNSVYHSNGNCLIETATKTLILGCKNSVIPTDGSVTSIGNYAFYGCSSLTSIEIPDSVTSIGNRAFVGCSSLTSIEIPDGVTSIDEGAFYRCSSLTSIEIPDSVTSIGEGAFAGCSSLTSVEIPDSVTSIGDYAFEYCSSLTSIEIPDSVTSIGKRAFYGCSSLTSINFNGTKAQWNAITKGSSWNYNTGNYTIYCTDGNISK